MAALFKRINPFNQFFGSGIWLGVVFMASMLSGYTNIETDVTIYENEQWQASQSVELSAEVVKLMAAEDTSVADISQKIAEAESLAQQDSLNFTFSQETREDGSMVIETAGNGQGFEQLNEMFFDGNADISVNEVDGQRQVTIRQMGIDSSEMMEVGASNVIIITGKRIVQSNAGQVQLNATAIWENPNEIDVTLTEVAGDPSPLAAQGAEYEAEAKAEPETVNVIKNGDFDKPWEFMNGVAPDWNPYDNGLANFGWYDEQWAEAVRKGRGHAQLLEIHETEPNALDRTIAIYQTVDVASNAQYELTIYAIMRTDAALPDRNKYEYEMHWGIDPWGEGNYGNVETWAPMPLTEQNRIGSNAAYPEDIPLLYERITGTVRTGANTNSITLFIRGLKKFSYGTEVDFDIDDVSLVGPPPGIVLPAAHVSQSQPAPSAPVTTETAAADDVVAPAEETNILPPSGATLSSNPSLGIVAIGGLVLVILGATATAGLLAKRKEA